MASISALLGLDTKDFDKGLKRAEGLTSKLGQKLSGVLSVAAFTLQARNAIAYADQVDRAALKTGLMTTEVQKLNYAARINKASNQDVEQSMVALSRRTVDMEDNFKKWGVATRDVNGVMRSNYDILLSVADRMKNAANQGERLAMADALMSEAGRKLVPLLQQGSAAIKALGEEADEAGRILDERTVAALVRANDGIERLKTGATATFGNIFAGLFAPQDTDDIKLAFVDLLRWFSDSFGNNLLKIFSLIASGITATFIKATEEIQERLDKFRPKSISPIVTPGAFGQIADNANVPPPGSEQPQRFQARSYSQIFNASIDGVLKRADERSKLISDAFRDFGNLIAPGAREQKEREAIDAERQRLELTKQAASAITDEWKERTKLTAAIRDAARLEKQRDKLQTQLSDRSKMSLGELASLSQFGVGTSIEAGNQSRTAREVLDLEKRAEQLRKSGMGDSAEGLLERAGQLRSGLSMLKSEERTMGDQLKTALSETEKELAKVNETLQGKFANQ